MYGIPSLGIMTGLRATGRGFTDITSCVLLYILSPSGTGSEVSNATEVVVDGIVPGCKQELTLPR